MKFILHSMMVKLIGRNYLAEIFNHRFSSNLFKLGRPPWKILFFGTDDFSLCSLKALYSKLRTGTLIETLGIVTKAGSVVEKFGVNEGLTSYRWPLKSVDINNKYDVGMVVSFGNMIPQEIIQCFPLGCINVHASILPRWRGAAPIFHAVMNGDTETGITIMRIHPYRFDVGEIVRQYRIPIENNETTLDLEKKLAKHGSALLIECLRDLPRCIKLAVAQPNQGIKYAPKIRSEMSLICWDKMSAGIIYNLHRALQHVYPVTTKWHGSVVKFIDVSLQEENIKAKLQCKGENMTEHSKDCHKNALSFLINSDITSDSLISPSRLSKCCIIPGSLHFVKKQRVLVVSCCDANHIIVKKLKISGKTMTAVDFYNGFLIKTPKEEWIFSN